MSLFIDDKHVIGLYAFNQWFEVEKGSIEIDIFDLTYATKNDKSFFYNMGVFYPKIENNGYTRTFESGINPGTISEFCKIDEFTRDTGISFIEAKSDNRISFSLAEVKAFREDFSDHEDESDAEDKAEE